MLNTSPRLWTRLSERHRVDNLIDAAFLRFGVGSGLSSDGNCDGIEKIISSGPSIT
jgi:hypothetical protein